MKSFFLFALVNSLLALGYLVVYVIHHLRLLLDKMSPGRRPPV